MKHLHRTGFELLLDAVCGDQKIVCARIATEAAEAWRPSLETGLHLVVLR